LLTLIYISQELAEISEWNCCCSEFSQIGTTNTISVYGNVSPASSQDFEKDLYSYKLHHWFFSVNSDHIRHYQGLDLRHFQTARPLPHSSSTRLVPLCRQLAAISNPDQGRLIRSLNLCRESDRHQTFLFGWPSDSAPPGRDMAAAGWFYLGNLDRTQCFCCGGVLRNWRRLDNPNTEHISHFPHCPMAQGQESRNVPDEGLQVRRVQRFNWQGFHMIYFLLIIKSCTKTFSTVFWRFEEKTVSGSLIMPFCADITEDHTSNHVP